MSEGRTIRARRLKDGTLVEVLPDGTTRSFPPDDTDWAALRRMTEEEINAAALTDPDNPPRTPEREKHLRRVPQVKVMRRALGLTQEEFATRFHIPLGTLRDWEQGKTQPDQAARAYLTVIARNPKAVLEGLEPPMTDTLFLERNCPHLWALLNQRAKRDLPNGIREFLSGADGSEGRNQLRLADKRIAELIGKTSEKTIGDAYRSRVSGVTTESQLAELLCELTLVGALANISSSSPELQPTGKKGKCDVRVTLDEVDLYGEVKRLADTWEGGKRSIVKSENHDHSLRPRAMALFSKLKNANPHAQLPEGTLNVLFLFHPSWGSTHLYIQLALFGDPNIEARSHRREIASALERSVRPTLHDGLYSLPEWQTISACAHVRVKPDGALSIERIWRNPKANVALPDSIEKKLMLAQ